MSILSPIISVFNWFKKTFIDHTKSAASVAVTITEAIKTLLSNPIAHFLEEVVDSVTHTTIASNIAALINAAIPKILAIELGIEGLPDNPTPEQILAFENQILQAFSVAPGKDRLYTTLAAQIYGIIQANLSSGKTTFADWVVAVETAYQDYLKDLANSGIVNAPVGTILPDGNMVVEDPDQARLENQG